MTTPQHPAAVGVRPIHRSVLVDDVYEAIKALIMDHAIAPGDRIGIESLARDLDVSPTPVREAMARLEAERLATKEPLKGYRATPLMTKEQLIDMFGFRLLVEPWAAGEAARRADNEQRSVMAAEMAEHAVAPDGAHYRDYRGLTDHDQRFHRMMFEAAGNEHATRAFESLHVHLHLFRFYYGTSQGPGTINEHITIADAIIAADSGAATAAMKTHLTNSLDRLEPVFEGTTTNRQDDS